MADRTTSQLTAATRLTGGEIFPGVQDGAPKKFTPQIIRGNGVVSADDHGAIGDGDPALAAANTTAFNNASAEVMSNGGGRLIIPPGTYYVGKQDFAGELGLNYAYRGYDIVPIHNCSAPVKVIAEGVNFIFVDGLKFGSFDPVTGAVHNPPPGLFTNGNYAAKIGRGFYFTQNLKVEVIGPLFVDGNITNMSIGGRWGDVGIQLQATGVEGHNNGSLTVRDADCDYLGLDGFQTGHSTQTLALDPRPVILENCRARYNGRQGWSIVGGIQTTAINCDFSHTGKNGTVASNPGAGVDIENEGQGIRNVTFINCRMFDNTGVAVVSDGTNVRDVHFYGCRIIGTTSYATWLKVRGVKMFGCTVVGAQINQYDASSDPEYAFTAYDTIFSQSTSTSLTPSGVVYTARMDFVNAKNAKFYGCTFDTAARAHPTFTSQSARYAQFHGCFFRLNNGVSNALQGVFTGRNVVEYTGTLTTTNVVNRGSLVINGVESLRGTPVVDASGGRSLSADDTGIDFHNNGATAVSSFILPTGIAGLEYGFYVDDNSGLSVSCQSGATIRINANTGTTFESTTVGSYLRLLCIDATKWIAKASSGTWAAPAAGNYHAPRYFAPRYFAPRYFG